MDQNWMLVVKALARVPIRRARIFVCAFTLLAITVPSASARDLKGRVVNGTTRKAAAGDAVVLLSLSSDRMNETARTQTDSKGQFSLPLADPEAAHVVRVFHEGVTYHQVVPPFANAVAIGVYDVTPNPDNLSAVMDVERFEATDDRLEVKQLITMRNASNPRRTVVKDHSFEIQLPPQAELQYGFVQFEDGQPLKQKAIAGDHPGQYYFVFPMRPGDTRFAMVYQVPYKGGATIQPTIRNPQERFTVMLPKSMKFEPTVTSVFQPMPGTTPDNVQGTGPLTLDNTVSFRISGTGTLAELEGHRKMAKVGEASSTRRPGGGLGPPIDVPDPLQQYRWFILCSLSVILLAGAVVVTRRQRLPGSAAQALISQRVAARQIPRRTQRHSVVSGSRRKERRSQTSYASTQK
jgi:hypothetical protein